MQRLMGDPGHIDAVLKDGAESGPCHRRSRDAGCSPDHWLHQLIVRQLGLQLVWNYSRKTLY
jgi:hypothetical protein